MFRNASSRSFEFAPDLVLGQPDLVTVSPGTSATKMSEPLGVFVDAADNLWVADYLNHRVLKFANASSLTNGAAATTVLGQQTLDSKIPLTVASDTNLAGPSAVTVDGAGRLWVADTLNSRVLRFDRAASLANGSAATAVLGQPNFSTSSYGTTAQKMEHAFGVLLDPHGTLYVSDFGNHRVLVFRNAARKANGAPADRVIGQPDFTTGTGGTTERSLYGPAFMAFDRAGHLWVAATSNERVLRFSPDWMAARPKVTGRVPKMTTREALSIKGTAADRNGIAEIRYRVGGKGAFRKAKGTETWRFRARLKPGKPNLIEIVMIDGAGNTSSVRKLLLRTTSALDAGLPRPKKNSVPPES
jgi:sugar lactone lactonase YvrE